MNKTLLKIAEILFIFIIIIIFLGGILYCVSEMKESIQIKETLFWSAIILIFMMQIQRGISAISSGILEDVEAI